MYFIYVVRLGFFKNNISEKRKFFSIKKVTVEMEKSPTELSMLMKVFYILFQVMVAQGYTIAKTK